MRCSAQWSDLTPAIGIIAKSILERIRTFSRKKGKTIQDELRMLLQQHVKMHTTANSSISLKKIADTHQLEIANFLG